MHWNDGLGRERSHRLRGFLRVYGEVSAYGDEQPVEASDLLYLLLGEQMAQVAEVGDPDAVGAEDPDDIRPALGALRLVVEAVYLFDVERVGDFRGDHLDEIDRVVVAVLMAADHEVGLGLGVSVAPDSAEGIHGYPKALFFDDEAGMSKPCEFHLLLLLFAFKAAIILSMSGKGKAAACRAAALPPLRRIFQYIIRRPRYSITLTFMTPSMAEISPASVSGTLPLKSMMV